MRALYDTGRYDIKLLAINHFGQFHDLEKYPYQAIPAKLLDPNDPYGNRMFLKTIQEEDPFDVIFILNDTYVVSGVAKELRKIIRDRQLPTKVIYYYPVDSAIQADNAGMLLEADKLVTYTNWARQKTLDILPDLEPPEVIYHGTDTNVFKPLDVDRRRAIRRDYLRIVDDSTFLIININRNSLRKDLARTILAYSEFKKKVPNSLLYLHTSVRDQMLDLMPAIKQLGLEMHYDVLFPENYSPINGVAEEMLNFLYNAADVYLTTSLGEGFGLGTSDSLAAGTLAIAGNHSSTPEILGQDGERGLVYPCKELVWIDNCYDPKTEVLTNTGFKYFKDVVPEDKICTLCPDTHEIEYHYPERIIRGQYKGKMYHLSHRKCGIDMLVTENHDLYTFMGGAKRGTWGPRKPSEIFGKNTIKFKKSGTWKGKDKRYFKLPSVGNEPIRKIDMGLWLEFLGYFISEGSTTYAKGSHYIVQIHQNPGQVLDRIIELAQEIGFYAHRASHSGARIYNKQLYSYLKELGKSYEKYIPDHALGLPPHRLRILFEALMAGDGHNLYYRDFNNRDSVKTKGGSSYATCSKRLRDNFQELLLKLGYSGKYRLQTPAGTAWHIEGRSGTSKHDLWVVGVSYTNNTPNKRPGYDKVGRVWVRKDKWQEAWEDYNGLVYCLTVPNNIMYTRRNGCVVWSGNSSYRPMGHLEDIVAKLHQAHDMTPEERFSILERGRDWANTYSWKSIGEAWVRLFDKVLGDHIEKTPTILSEDL